METWPQRQRICVPASDQLASTLEGYPGWLQVGRWLEPISFACRARFPFQSIAAAERFCQRQIRAEAQADGSKKRIGRSLDESGIDQGGSGGVSHQHRLHIARKIKLFLNELAQRFEICSTVRTFIIRACKSLQVAGDVDTYNKGVQGGQTPGHVNHPQVPASIAGNKQNNLGWLGRLAVQSDMAEATEGNRFLCGIQYSDPTQEE